MRVRELQQQLVTAAVVYGVVMQAVRKIVKSIELLAGLHISS